MAKTNKQLQKEIDKLTIEKNNLVDMLEIAEKWIRWVSKILWLDWIAENTYFNDADIDCIIKTVEKLKADKKDLHKKLMEWLNCNNEKVEKIRELEDKVDEQFKVITKYEKELEEQDKEIEELKEENKKLEEEDKEIKEKVLQIDTFIKLNNKIEELKEENHDLDTMLKNATERIKELEEQNFGDYWDGWRSKQAEYMGKKLREVREQLSKKQNTIVLSNKQNQDLFDALQKELQSQIILKNTYKKENKRLKKRRREWRYNIDKFITNLTKWAYVYVEWASRPTKLHKRLTDAIAEKQRLEKKTNKKVYILTNL